MPQGLNSPEKVLVALQMCHELGLPPITSVGKICVINGTASLFGELPLALVMRSGLLESIDEKISDTDGSCTVKRKGMEPITRAFSKADAEKAGLWGKNIWAKYPKRMLQLRSRAWALRDYFPDVLMGCPILEYDSHTTIEPGVQIKSSTIADELNETFLKEENHVNDESTGKH